MAAAAIVSRGSLAQDATPAGATAMMAHPLSAFDIYVVGLHCAKDDPLMQSEAHHFCQKLSDGTIQCAIFDGGDVGAKLMGLEYIISADAFATLDEAEQDYWHPHNYEVLGGQLTAPEMDDAGELELMTQLMNSYGKTWHAWHTGRPDGEGQPGDPLPMGPAMLQWSFNADGEADPSLVDHLTEELGYSIEEKREARAGLVELAQPQEGVDDLAGDFPDATPIPGVEAAD